ncbi:MAG: helix-turn-helix transcriptional regulator [Chloroflexi bacterium]|nr:helix-turn-helix transcriptional regulator [Chloroflexota bacterium]
MESFPFDLAAARRSSYMSQRELADKSGVSLRQIQDIERGKVANCRPYTVRQLARALNVDLSVSPQRWGNVAFAVEDARTLASQSLQQSMFDLSISDEAPLPSVANAGLPDLQARRVRTLLLTRVLNELQANRALHVGWELYDMHALQLRAIQTVVEHMELLTGGITRLALSANLVDFARWMAPDREAATHQDVADEVISWLLNDKEREVFTPSYVDFGADRTPVRRQMSIELLRERQEPDGSLVLRASVEAINLLLGTLSDDVADAQRAEERLLDDFIETGRYDAAVDQARRAQLRSIQYAEQVSRWLATARQDLSQLDWTGTVKDDHDRALAHIKDRLADESRMRDRVGELLREVVDSDKRVPMLNVIKLLKDCHLRHTQLHGLLMDTGPTFRYEQERQRFVHPLALSRIAMRQALETILDAPIRSFVPSDKFFRAVIGPTPPRLLDLVDLSAELNAPARDSVSDAPEIPELVLEESEQLGIFPIDARKASDEALATIGRVPRRLSELIEEARRNSSDHPELAAELTRLRALDAFAPEGRDSLAGGELTSEKDGQKLSDRTYNGDDLLVRREIVLSLPSDGLANEALPRERMSPDTVLLREKA